MRGAFHRDRVEKDAGDISPFQALTTAMAATIGNGNIAGVATAIAVGGPGAAFWMVIIAPLGMASKFAEAVLAVRYRERSEDGTILGGPMMYLKRGAGRHWPPCSPFALAWVALVPEIWLRQIP